MHKRAKLIAPQNGQRSAWGHHLTKLGILEFSMLYAKYQCHRLFNLTKKKNLFTMHTDHLEFEVYRITLNRSLYARYKSGFERGQTNVLSDARDHIRILLPPRTFLQYRKPQIFCNRKHQSQERTEVHRLTQKRHQELPNMQ